MSDRNKYSEDSNNFYLNEQNKKKQKELEEKFGMEQMYYGDNTPPEIMNNFLNYVEQFEKAAKNPVYKKVIEVLGYPQFIPFNKLESEKLDEKIEEVLKLYSKHDISVSVIEVEDVTSTDYYKFLTEELPQHEMEYIAIEGLTTNFIYEEFHPSDKLNAKDAINFFFRALAQRDIDELKLWTSKDNLHLNGILKSNDDFIQELFKLFPLKFENYDIDYKSFDCDDKILVEAMFKITEFLTEEQKFFEEYTPIKFDLERSEFGGMDIKGIELN